MTLYETLGVAKEATQKEIKAAWKLFAQKHHPDKTGDAVTAGFNAARDAYSILGNVARRAKYDATGNTEIIPPLEQGAREYIRNEFIGVININVDVTRINVISCLRRGLSEKQAKIRNSVLKAEKQYKNLSQLLNQLSSNNMDDELFGAPVARMLSDINKFLSAAEKDKALLTKVEEILSHHTWKSATRDIPESTLLDVTSTFYSTGTST